MNNQITEVTIEAPVVKKGWLVATEGRWGTNSYGFEEGKLFPSFEDAVKKAAQLHNDNDEGDNTTIYFILEAKAYVGTPAQDIKVAVTPLQ